MSLTERIVELTSALVAIPTVDREVEAQDLIASWLSAAGFDCELQEVAPGRPNLIAQRGTGGPFLCSHVDIHPPHGHPDPFSCKQQGEMLIGRGVLDAKGQIAALITALETEPDAPALVAITCDEEAGGIGSRDIKLPGGAWTTDGGIVLEPTDFRICVAQGGNIDIDVEVSGTPGHAFAPETGGSPIAAVLAALDTLETCSFLSARHPLIPPPSLNVGRIEGGEHIWRRPARARVGIGLGIVPGVDLEQAVAEVRARLEDLAERWGSRGTSFLFQILDSSAAIEVPRDLPIIDRLGVALGKPFEPAGMPSWTDAGYLLEKHGLPCVIFGAGDMTSAHSDHEWVRLGDLSRLADVLKKVIQSAN